MHLDVTKTIPGNAWAKPSRVVGPNSNEVGQTLKYDQPKRRNRKNLISIPRYMIEDGTVLWVDNAGLTLCDDMT